MLERAVTLTELEVGDVGHPRLGHENLFGDRATRKSRSGCGKAAVSTARRYDAEHRDRRPDTQRQVAMAVTVKAGARRSVRAA